MSKLMILQCARTQKKTIRIGYLLTKLKWYPRCISHLLWKDHPNRRHLPVPRGTTGAHLASQQHNNWFLSTPVDSLTMKKSKDNLNVTLRKALSLFSRLSIGDIVMNTNEINHNNDPQPISFFFLTANYHLAQTLLSSHCHNCLEPGRLCLLIFILFWAPQLFTSCLICERGLAQPCRALPHSGLPIKVLLDMLLCYCLHVICTPICIFPIAWAQNSVQWAQAVIASQKKDFLPLILSWCKPSHLALASSFSCVPKTRQLSFLFIGNWAPSRSLVFYFSFAIVLFKLSICFSSMVTYSPAMGDKSHSKPHSPMLLDIILLMCSCL